MAQITITSEDIPSTITGRTVKIVHFSGQLDESNIDDRAKDIYEIISNANGALYMIFDFANLEYMNSKSIGYLTDWYTKLSEKKGAIIIAQARPNILDILNVVGITQLIKAVASIEEATRAANA